MAYEDSVSAPPAQRDARSDVRAAARVFFDGGCPVCRREIGMYRGMSGADRVDWVDLQTDPLPPGFNREAMMQRFTVERRDGRLASGAEAFVALWRAMPATRWIGRLTDNAPITWVLERAYRGFLKLRRLWRR